MKKIFKVLSTAALLSISSVSMAQASDDPAKNVPASSIGSIRKAEVMHVTCPNGLMATSFAVCNGLTGNQCIQNA